MNLNCALHRVEPKHLIMVSLVDLIVEKWVTIAAKCSLDWFFKATVQALRDFHDWLSQHEEKLDEYAANKPKTRVQACQLLAIATVIQQSPHYFTKLYYINQQINMSMYYTCAERT